MQIIAFCSIRHVQRDIKSMVGNRTNIFFLNYFVRHTLKMNVDGKHLIFFFTILFYFQIIYNIYANLRQADNLLQDDMLDIAYFRRI